MMGEFMQARQASLSISRRQSWLWLVTKLWASLVFGGIACMGLIGCKDLAGTPPLPAGTGDPGSVQNVNGAVETAVGAQVVFQQAFADYIPISGELTDELKAFGAANSLDATAQPDPDIFPDVTVDARRLDQSSDWSPPPPLQMWATTDTVYGRLQAARAALYQAIGGLAAYAPDSVGVRGKMYALLGYTEIMLADLFCSGVPLSTMDFQGDYTYQPGSATSQIYQHAIAVFDSALTLAANTPQIEDLARVGQGRAYLALGNYASAGQSVALVPANFLFTDSLVMWDGSSTYGAGNGAALSSAEFAWQSIFSSGYTVSDKEAGMGLPFVSSHDPRTADTVLVIKKKPGPQYFPSKYHSTGVSAFAVASGIEAQLITAEAELNSGNASGAFAILNALRQSNPSTSGMPILTDPGTFGAEVDTLFTERAAWLFVDGHRQGDLRRLMRNYVHGQSVQVVANQYPSGDYGFGLGLYGDFIDAPVPALELINPHFTGCLSRD